MHRREWFMHGTGRAMCGVWLACVLLLAACSPDAAPLTAPIVAPTVAPPAATSATTAATTAATSGGAPTTATTGAATNTAAPAAPATAAGTVAGAASAGGVVTPAVSGGSAVARTPGVAGSAAASTAIVNTTPIAALIPTPGGAPLAASLPPGVADKVDPVFIDLIGVYQTQGPMGALKFARDKQLLNEKDDIRLSLTLDSEDPAIVDNTAVNVARLGGRVTASVGNQMDMIVPLQTLVTYAQTMNQMQFFTDLAQFQHVKEVRRTPVPLVGDAVVPLVAGAAAPGQPGVTDEGIAVVGADKWRAAGITGKGVKVGIIDGSFNNYQKILGGLALKPKTMSFRSDKLIESRQATSGTIHGTAVAEVVSKTAPDAQLYLVAVDTELGFVQAVNYLTQEGVAVITASLGYPSYLKDGTSPMAKAVDAARAAGIFVTVSAGNSASGKVGSNYLDAHFAGKFTDADGDGVHDFPGLRNKNLMAVVANGGLFYLTLIWADYDKQQVDYNLFVLDKAGKVVQRSTSKQGPGLGKLPQEVIADNVDEGVYFIAIQKVNKNDPDLEFHLYVRGAQFEQTTPQGSLFTPADARGAFAIAATNWRSNEITEYSSLGATQDGRKKPDIAAPSEVSSESYMLIGGRTFGGTSAAAPHAAGAVVLYRQAFPNATPDEIAKYFLERAKRVSGPRSGDNVAGPGIIFLGEVPRGASMVGAPARATPTRGTGGTPSAAFGGTQPAGGTTPRPGVSPTASAGVFRDDFRDPRSGLPANGYRNGEYRVQAAGGSYLRVTYGQSVRNPQLVYEVTAQKVSGPNDAAMGLMVRQLDQNNYIYFILLADGTIDVLVKVNGSLQSVLDDPVNARGVMATGKNVLRVVADGDKFTFSVNGQNALSITLEGVWTEGAFGLVAGGGERQPAEIAFTNFSVTTR